MTTRLKGSDVVIVGLGTAGGIAALPLARAGLDVVGLAAGPRVSRHDVTVDEYSLIDVKRIKSPHELPTWRPNAAARAQRLHVSTRRGPLMLNAVGGTSITYASRSYRLPPSDFLRRSCITSRCGASAVPDDCTVADWPLTYDDLEPFYDKVEYAIGVSGDAGANPFEGLRARPYPMPAVRASGYNNMMRDAACRLDWHPYIVPVAVNSEPYNERAACTYCGFCTNNGCHVDAKGATNVSVIPEAERSGRLRIEPNARVLRIDVNGDGRASGVTFVRDREEFFQPARVVLIATYTYENTRLLLTSVSNAFPNGLSNNHGQVGKHYTAHMTSVTHGVFPGRKLNRWGGPGAGTAVDDWCTDNFDHTGLGFVTGGLLTDGAGSAQTLTSLVSTVPPGQPSWGSKWKAWISLNANALGMVSGSIEALTYAGNYLDLDPDARDPLGVPVVRITHDWRNNERRCAEFIGQKQTAWLVEAGAASTWTTTASPAHVSLHAYGGTRMGLDPESSVVNRWCFSHEVPNLGVLGASCMPTSGSHNPALTVQALAWWTADHLLVDWRSIANA